WGVFGGACVPRWGAAARGWARPGGGGWPVIAVEEPCVLRQRALAALDARGLEPYVACESGYVAGGVDAARAGPAPRVWGGGGGGAGGGGGRRNGSPCRRWRRSRCICAPGATPTRPWAPPWSR